jgi:hypothetical protein
VSGTRSGPMVEPRGGDIISEGIPAGVGPLLPREVGPSAILSSSAPKGDA